MRIGILICGHIRTFNQCIDNFKAMLINNDNEIDIFLHLYNNIYNTTKIYENYEILKMFDGLNIINYSFEDINDIIVNDIKDNNINMYQQQRKISLCKDLLVNHMKLTGIKYDLIIKTRADIIYEDIINYSEIYEKVHNNETIIYTSNLTGYNSDILAISNANVMINKYCNLIDTYREALNYFEKQCVEMNIHIWMYYYIICKYYIKRISNINLEIKR